jgi:hypothetical protein
LIDRLIALCIFGLLIVGVVLGISAVLAGEQAPDPHTACGTPLALSYTVTPGGLGAVMGDTDHLSLGALDVQSTNTYHAEAKNAAKITRVVIDGGLDGQRHVFYPGPAVTDVLVPTWYQDQPTGVIYVCGRSS